MTCLSGRPIPILNRFALSSSLIPTGRRPAIRPLLSTYIKWKFPFTAYLCSGSGEGASANKKKTTEDALMHHQTEEDHSGRKGILESGLYIVATPIGNLEDITLRRCVIAREMTKLHEEFWRGTLAEAKSEFSRRNLKGEITLVIEGSEDNSAEAPTEAELESQLQDLFSTGHSLSEAVKLVSKRMSVRKKAVYTLALKMHGNGHESEKRVHNMDNDIHFDE